MVNRHSTPWISADDAVSDGVLRGPCCVPARFLGPLGEIRPAAGHIEDPVLVPVGVLIGPFIRELPIARSLADCWHSRKTSEPHRNIVIRVGL